MVDRMRLRGCEQMKMIWLRFNKHNPLLQKQMRSTMMTNDSMVLIKNMLGSRYLINVQLDFTNVTMTTIKGLRVDNPLHSDFES